MISQKTVVTPSYCNDGKIMNIYEKGKSYTALLKLESFCTLYKILTWLTDLRWLLSLSRPLDWKLFPLSNTCPDSFSTRPWTWLGSFEIKGPTSHIASGSGLQNKTEQWYIFWPTHLLYIKFKLTAKSVSFPYLKILL